MQTNGESLKSRLPEELENLLFFYTQTHTHTLDGTISSKLQYVSKAKNVFKQSQFFHPAVLNLRYVDFISQSSLVSMLMEKFWELKPAYLKVAKAENHCGRLPSLA